MNRVFWVKKVRVHGHIHRVTSWKACLIRSQLRSWQKWGRGEDYNATTGNSKCRGSGAGVLRVWVTECLGWGQGLDVGRPCQTYTGLGVSLQRHDHCSQMLPMSPAPIPWETPMSERRKTQVCQCMVMTACQLSREGYRTALSRESDPEKIETLADNRKGTVWFGFQAHSRTRFSNLPLGLWDHISSPVNHERKCWVSPSAWGIQLFRGHLLDNFPFCGS